MKQPAVYQRANGRNGTSYTGAISNLAQRVWQRREYLAAGFANDHHVTMLVDHEPHASMEAAICREEQVRKWCRAGTLRRIEAGNPYWRDLWRAMVHA